MSRLRVNCFSLSLDGFGAGPNQSLENPLGVGGHALHQWIFPTRTFQKLLFGKDGGTTGPHDDFAARGFDNVGAWILGRNMFGPVRGAWPDESWKGWWGENPPYEPRVARVGRREVAVAGVGRVRGDERLHRLDLGLRLARLAGLREPHERRREEDEEDRDDREHDEDLDQREAAIAARAPGRQGTHSFFRTTRTSSAVNEYSAPRRAMPKTPSITA